MGEVDWKSKVSLKILNIADGPNVDRYWFRKYCSCFLQLVQKQYNVFSCHRMNVVKPGQLCWMYSMGQAASMKANGHHILG